MRYENQIMIDDAPANNVPLTCIVPHNQQTNLTYFTNYTPNYAEMQSSLGFSNEYYGSREETV